MRASVRVIYSSEGKSPEEVRQIMAGLGFSKVKGQPAFAIDVLDDEALNSKLEEVHAALRGMGVRYSTAIEAEAGEACSSEGELASWKALGMDVDELRSLLDSNIKTFKQTAMAKFQEKVDSVASLKEKELAEIVSEKEKAEAERMERERVEGRINKLMEMLAYGNGVTFQDLYAASGYETEELIELLKGLVSSGKARADQKGKNVIYFLSTA